MPPNSVGLLMPRRPASPSFLNTTWAGKMPSSSHWSTCGLMSLSMMARRVRRISACSWVNCMSAISQSGHVAHQLGDDLQHDLVGAAADRAQPAVAIAARHRAVPQVARAAPILQAGVADLAAQATGLQLGHRGQHGDVLAREIFLAGAVDQRTQRLDLALELSQAEVDHLVVEQRLAEHLALAGVVDGGVDDAVAAHQGAGAGPQPLLLELLHLIDEALARLA